jgi:hypothetical protein
MMASNVQGTSLAGFLDALVWRDQREKDVFVPVFAAYSDSLKRERNHRARVFDLENQILQDARSTSSSMGGAEDGGTPDSASQAKISRLQEELIETYRLKAEAQAALSRFKENAAKDERELIAKQEEIAVLHQQISTLTQASSEDQNAIATPQTTVTKLQTEVN